MKPRYGWRRWFMLGLAFAGVALAAAADRPLMIALEETPPAEYQEAGQPTGINVEIMRRIFARLDVPVDFQFYPWSRTLMLAQKGKVDLVSMTSYQPAREEFLLFTDEQRAFPDTGRIPSNILWVAEYDFFAQRRCAAEFVHDTVGESVITDRVLGIVRDYSYAAGFLDRYPNRKTYPSVGAAMTALAAGEVDLVPMEITIGQGVVDRQALAGKIARLQRSLFRKPYYLAPVRGSDYPGLTNLTARFDAELLAMRASGEYASIHEHFVPPPHLRNVPRPVSFVCEEWLPYAYLEDGVAKGLDAAVVDHVMRWLNVPYTISIYPWSRAWLLAQKGKADAVLAVSYKASREPDLFYTDDQRRYAETGELPANYLWLSKYVFFAMKNAGDRVRFESYDQVKRDGLRVGRNRDYTYDPAFCAADFTGSCFANTEQGFLALVAGAIDLYPMDEVVGLATLRKLGLQESITALPKVLFTKPYLSPFCRHSDLPGLEKIMDAFYRELRIMRANGTYTRIRDAAATAPTPPAGGTP